MTRNYWQGLPIARAEAKKAFGDEAVYLEKFITQPKHIEIQLMADKYGNVVHLGERDCSIQRRHQKLIEIAPSLVLTPEKREAMGEIAKKAAREINYHTVGTVEFLVDQDLNYYFLEMNTRIQVEHTITEIITGIDIVKEQIKLAAGEPLCCTQDRRQILGPRHSVPDQRRRSPEQFLSLAGQDHQVSIPRRHRHPHRWVYFRRLRGAALFRSHVVKAVRLGDDLGGGRGPHGPGVG